MALVWILLALSGFGLAAVASRRALDHASALALALDLPPFVIGLSIVSIGTDIPELANSIVSSLAGHGDVNVGDSVGSVVTQITLVLGLLLFLGASFRMNPRRVSVVGFLTVGALALGAWLASDGVISRLDGVLLVLAWVAGTALSWRFVPAPAEPPPDVVPESRLPRHLLLVTAWLGVVGLGAGAVVKAVVELSAIFGAPEYLISFFGASVGTSLPEMVVDITAIRSKRADLAIGDVFGSCLVDATLSIGIGPTLAPIAVSADLGIRGAITAMAIVAAVSTVVLMGRGLGRKTGLALLGLYLLSYAALLARGGGS